MEALQAGLAQMVATQGIIALVLVMTGSLGLAFGAIWFAYDPVAKLCRVRLTKDAVVMQRIMETSFVPMTLDECAMILARIFWGTVLLLFLFTLFLGKPNIIVALVFGTLAYIGANVWVRRQVASRLALFEKQLPDVLTLMSNTLKSGLTLQQALEICAREMAKPAKHEFFLVMQEIKVGATPEEALEHLAERMPLQELEMLATTVATLRQAGGNLAQSFEVISKVIKDRNAVKGKIKSLTAEAMFQGLTLVALPFIFMILLFVTSREFIMPMFVDPIGWAFIVGIILLVSLGYWLMQKLVQIDV